ncbi:Alpha/beta hydrolase family protein [compost metagenome]
MKNKIIAIALCCVLKMHAQKIEKVALDKSDPSKNCYTAIVPEKQPLAGFLVLIPGFGETAERAMEQTDLPLRCAEKGLLVIIPTLSDGVLSFGVDTPSQQSLAAVIDDAVKKYKLSGQRLYIGGFSIGGSAAVKYAELSAAESRKTKPVAVFAIDPPLDFERFYNSSLRDIRLSAGSQPNQENVYMVGRIEEVMGGTPEKALQNYHAISPYSFSDEEQKAAKHLVNVPIRLYAEPDVNWWIENRGSDFSAMNALDCSALVNELRRLGNLEAALVLSENKGYRKPDHKRHPHSWSIVDNGELIAWLLAHR